MRINLTGTRMSKYIVKSLIFSPKQIEIMSLIAQGYDNQYIADKLFLGKKTIEFYISRIYEKIRLNENTENKYMRVLTTIVYQDIKKALADAF